MTSTKQSTFTSDNNYTIDTRLFLSDKKISNIEQYAKYYELINNATTYVDEKNAYSDLVDYLLANLSYEDNIYTQQQVDDFLREAQDGIVTNNLSDKGFDKAKEYKINNNLNLIDSNVINTINNYIVALQNYAIGNLDNLNQYITEWMGEYKYFELGNRLVLGYDLVQNEAPSLTTGNSLIKQVKTTKITI